MDSKPEYIAVRYRAKHTKDSRFSKWIVVLSVLLVLVYTAVYLYFVWEGKYIPAELTYSFFATFSVELSALAGIRIKKQLQDKNNINGGLG